MEDIRDLFAGHHLWCNFAGFRPFDKCTCQEAWEKYPYSTFEEMENLAAKFFPDAIPRT